MTISMDPARASHGSPNVGAFRHEALLYAGDADFVTQVGAFIRDAIACSEPVLVVVGERKVEMLREALRRELTDDVRFAAIDRLGHNPARIIPAWSDFVAERALDGRRFRGVGEPMFAERPREELDELQRHESLLNLAFAASAPWWLLCPYDTRALEQSVVEGARRTHPFVLSGGASRFSESYMAEAATQPFDRPLPDPPVEPVEMIFGGQSLDEVRRVVREQAEAAGLRDLRVPDIVLAVNELATNSIRHGGGHGVLRVWHADRTFVCEIRDSGRIAEPLAGSIRPSLTQEGGHGLWLVNQLCDLVQMRATANGSVVRLHMRIV